MLGGYQGNANTAATAGKAFTDAFLDINNSANTTLGHAISLGDSYSRTGAQKVADLLSVAAGYANNAQTTGNLANFLMDAGSKRIQDYLGIAQGYGNAVQNQLAIAQGHGNMAGRYSDLSGGYLNNLNTNLAEREQWGRRTTPRRCWGRTRGSWSSLQTPTADSPSVGTRTSLRD